MADNDNKDIMQFLEKKFDGIEKQFEGIYKRLDSTASKDDLAGINKRLDNTATKDDIEEVKRHTGVLIEDVHHKLDIVIEGLIGANESRKREKEEIESELSRFLKMSLINTSDIHKLEQRVRKLEERA